MYATALIRIAFFTLTALGAMGGAALGQTVSALEAPLDALTEVTGIDTGRQKLVRVASFHRAGGGVTEEYAIEDYGTDSRTWLRDYCPIALDNLKSIEAVTLANSTSLHGYVKPYQKKKEWRFVRFGFKDAVEVQQYDTQFNRGLVRTRPAVFCEIGYALRTNASEVDALVRQADAILQGLSN